MSQLIQIKPQLNLPPSAGKKAASIGWLQSQGMTTPVSWVLPWDAHHAWQRTGQVDPAWLDGLDPSGRFAVRSSANLEDDPRFAFAGQFASVLNVTGRDNLRQAIETVFQSAESNTVAAYLAQNNLQEATVRMAVLIQTMVEPRISGVAFSKNPVTGFDETVVEAVEGSGERLVQEGITPARWVYKWGQWITRAAHPAIDEELIKQVVATTGDLAGRYDAPLDLEWVYDGQTVYWVQARPITTIEKLNIFSNRIAKEVLPGIILPLVWSTNIPLVNSAWIRIFTELIGRNSITPDELTRAIHYRAYFNMSTIGKIFVSLGMPEETLEVLMGLEGGDQKPTFRPSVKIVRHLPRMVRFAWHKWRFAAVIERQLPFLERYYREKKARPLPVGEAALLADIDELFARTIDMAYLNIVGPILAQVYGGMLNRRLKALEIDPARFDLKKGDAAFVPFDPNHHLHRLHDAYLALPPELRGAVERGEIDRVRRLAPAGFTAAVDDFLARFGHLSDSGNDFSHPPWRETPGLVLQLIAHFSPAAPGDDSGSLTPADLPPLPRGTRRALRRARRFQLYREQISSTYIFGYGLLRDRFLALGRSLAAREVIANPDDLFLLYLEEVRQLTAAGAQAAPAHDLVDQRRAEIRRVEPAVLPELVLGDALPPLETEAAADQERLQGIPTSRGYYQGPVRVIRQLSDFPKMTAGDVLVIPFSDVSWTPLFARAGAVVAESGGMLSHSSIVAREYSLPAVVSVDGATRLLQDGEIVTVNGFDGSIVLHRHDHDDAAH